MNRISIKDSNAVGPIIGGKDACAIIGTWEAWQTRNGLPIRAMQERDGSMQYRIKGFNSLTNAMKNILRDAISRNALWGSGPAGGLWTAGPYVALCTTTPDAASTLASLSPGVECSGGSYVRKAYTAAVTNYSFNNTASMATWTAGTDLTAGTVVTGCFLTPASTGTGSAPNTAIISFWALNGGNQTVASGNALNISYTMTIS